MSTDRSGDDWLRSLLSNFTTFVKTPVKGPSQATLKKKKNFLMVLKTKLWHSSVTEQTAGEAVRPGSLPVNKPTAITILPAPAGDAHRDVSDLGAAVSTELLLHVSPGLATLLSSKKHQVHNNAEHKSQLFSLAFWFMQGIEQKTL